MTYVVLAYPSDVNKVGGQLYCWIFANKKKSKQLSLFFGSRKKSTYFRSILVYLDTVLRISGALFYDSVRLSAQLSS